MSEQEYKECPHCGEEIKFRAIKCKHCHSFLEPTDESSEIPAGDEKRESSPAGEQIPPEPQESFPEQEQDFSDFSSKSKGFITSLFDVKMTEMVTPKIIRALFILGLLAIGLGMFTAIITSLITVGTTGFGTVFITLITAPIGAFLAVIFLRVYLELIILLFNIHDQLKEIKIGVRNSNE